jgi:hypothetical protein
VELYVLPSKDTSRDEAFVRRVTYKATDQTYLGKPIEKCINAVALHTRDMIKRCAPLLFERIRPTLRRIYWTLYPPQNYTTIPLIFRLKKRFERASPKLYELLRPTLRRMYWMYKHHDPSAPFVDLYTHTINTIGKADIYMAHDLPMLPVAVKAHELHVL